ncbi:MAG: glutamate-cysteine ligase family protein [Desulfuromonadales bacterium]|nr:glutamate-cysteine ligase family protein [Desulfuromonadales bacterium]
MSEDVLGLFQGYGVELEYMIVQRDTLQVLPIADLLLRSPSGEPVEEVEHGRLCWSNELVLHVVELKTNGPAPGLDGLDAEFGRQLAEINRRLAPLHGMLMPGAMHPWMDPETETRVWPYGNRDIYHAYDRIFGCRGHGWSNLQSAHLNLPFADDAEFGRLHAAIRLVLPLLPALAAASPVMGGRVTGLLDNRLEVYRFNQVSIPSITGQIIPEAAFTIEAYQRTILAAMYRDIAAEDPAGILQKEWLNSRGAIARFDRQTIEIRLLDVQECPQADLAILQLLVAVLKELTAERWTSLASQQAWHETILADLLQRVLREGRLCLIEDERYLSMFGVENGRMTVGELWPLLAERLIPSASPAWAVLQTLFDEGPLARRIVAALGEAPSPGHLVDVYRQLCDCLQRGELFHA